MRRWILGIVLILGASVLMAQTVTRTPWKASPGSTVTWTTPGSDSAGAFTSDGAGTVSLLTYQRLTGTNTITAYDNASGGSWRPPEATVATLPAASGATGKVYVITDGTSSSDCTTGGGSTRSLCVSNGTAWVALGGGGGGAGDITSVGDCLTGACDTIGAIRINPRVTTVADATSITCASDTTDICYQSNTQIAGTLTINAPTGTPVDGQLLEMRLKATNAQTFAWNAAFRGQSNLALPTVSSSGSKVDYYAFMRHNGDSKWDLLAVTSEAYNTTIGDASTNTSTSVDNEVVLFSGTGGKTLKRATQTGFLKGSTGVLSAVSTIVETDLALADNTTANVSTTAHGFAPKAPNDATKYLNGLGAYAAISSGTVALSEGANVSRAAIQTISNNINTAISFDTENRDDNAYWASGSPTKFTPPVTGWYAITCGVDWATNSTGGRYLHLYVNGAATQMASGVTVSTGFSDIQQNVSGVWYLLSTDYTEVYAFQNSGGNLNVEAARCQIARWGFPSMPATQTIAASDTVTADACGGIKRITAAGAVTTNTTNTFTAPAAGNQNCLMAVCNVGSNTITLDNNANFKSFAGRDVPLQADECVAVSSTGASGVWYQDGPKTSKDGHLEWSGPAATVGGSCGTGPTIVGNDNAGKITTGTGAPTSCTVTFATAWVNAPACNVTNETTANLARATSTTTSVVLAGTFVAGDVLAYSCVGYR